jgi:putative DNA primase/helicase
VFLNGLTEVPGDYAAVAAMESFIATHADRHSTDMAMLRGARLVTAQETEEGRSWAESKIKALTGGDPITARFMRQDNFTFQPQFKLVIAGNHKPGVQNVDEAIRRRFHLLPFVVTIPEEERDPTLPDKLVAEWGGILAWAIAGCLDWQRIGLSPPEVVRTATARYLEEEDSFGSWLDECCIQDGRGWESSGELLPRC